MHDASWQPPFLGSIWLVDLAEGSAWIVVDVRPIGRT